MPLQSTALLLDPESQLRLYTTSIISKQDVRFKYLHLVYGAKRKTGVQLECNLLVPSLHQLVPSSTVEAKSGALGLLGSLPAGLAGWSQMFTSSALIWPLGKLHT